MGDGDSDAAAASLLRVCSGDGTAPTYDVCCTKADGRRTCWPRGVDPHPPHSLASACLMGELVALDGGERGGSRCCSEPLPDMLHGLDGQDDYPDSIGTAKVR
ncbi:hypothetical protein ZWY2020_008815 [Hordeum vulgare]|nr:hypothetical protein ZWY2020_008815 [Hordeum vulgare]